MMRADEGVALAMSKKGWHEAIAYRRKRLQLAARLFFFLRQALMSVVDLNNEDVLDVKLGLTEDRLTNHSQSYAHHHFRYLDLLSDHRGREGMSEIRNEWEGGFLQESFQRAPWRPW